MPPLVAAGVALVLTTIAALSAGAGGFLPEGWREGEIPDVVAVAALLVALGVIWRYVVKPLIVWCRKLLVALTQIANGHNALLVHERRDEARFHAIGQAWDARHPDYPMNMPTYTDAEAP